MDLSKDNANIYQQLGQIQGSLSALSTQVTTGFQNFATDMAKARQEIITLGKEQDLHREALRKEIIARLDKDIVVRLKILEDRKLEEEGAKTEAKKHARNTSTFWAIVISVGFEIFKWVLTNITIH